MELELSRLNQKLSNNMKKNLTLLIFLILSSSALFAQSFKLGDAKGLFFGISVGPRFPIGDFADNQNIGVGGDVSLSYTDNKFLPVFFYGKLGYQHYPGKQNFYQNSDYSSFSSNVYLIELGTRYYFKPIFDEVVLLMPIAEGGISFGYFEKLHQYKIGSGHQDFVEEVTKTGFHLGAGFSMFLLDVLGSYNYFHNNQYISIDLKIRIPIYAVI